MFAARGVRPDSASTTGIRAIVRAGHHAATVAASIASDIATATSNHGMSNGSMRWLTIDSVHGENDVRCTGERSERKVAKRLLDQALRGIDDDDRGVRYGEAVVEFARRRLVRRRDDPFTVRLAQACDERAHGATGVAAREDP